MNKRQRKKHLKKLSRVVVHIDLETRSFPYEKPTMGIISEGTTTGRFSCKEPNISNGPGHFIKNNP